MIEKSIGKLRNLLKHREKITESIKSILKSDDYVLIVNKDNKYTIMGQTESESRTVHMIGTLAGNTAVSVSKASVDITPEAYLNQVNMVAIQSFEVPK